ACPGLRVLPGQHVSRRGGVRLARARQLRGRIDRGAGHAGHPRGHAVHRAGLRGRQPGRRHRPGRHRPPDPAAMIEAPAPLPAQDSTLPRGAVLRSGILANPLLVVAAAGSAMILLVALLAALVATLPRGAGTTTHPLWLRARRSAERGSGTNNVGRAAYPRWLYVARTPPLIAVIVLLLATALGIPLGVMAGYSGGWLDEVIMRITNIFLAFPPLLL